MLLRAFNSLGEVPKTTESIALVENALEIYEHVLQGKQKDRMQGLACFVLAKLYEQQGKNQKALDAYRLKVKGCMMLCSKKKALMT